MSFKEKNDDGGHYYNEDIDSVIHVLWWDSDARALINNQSFPLYSLHFQFPTLDKQNTFMAMIPPVLKAKLIYPTGCGGNSFYCYFDCVDKNEIDNRFMVVLAHKFINMNDKMKQCIARFYNINLAEFKIDDYARMIKDLNTAEQVFLCLTAEKLKKELANPEGVFQRLYQDALVSKDKNAIFNLGKFYQDVENDLDYALMCYQEVTADSVSYKEANLKIFEILMQLIQALCPTREDQKLLSDEALVKVNEYRCQCIVALLRAKDPGFQRTLDQLIAERCGEQGLHPSLTHIQADPDTILQLADKVGQSKKENQALSADNQFMKRKIAYLQQQLVYTEATVKRLMKELQQNNNEHMTPVVTAKKKGLFK